MNLKRALQACLTAGLLSCGLFCQQTYADSVEGSIAFGGNAKFDSKSLAKAANLEVWTNPFVMHDSGDFAAFAHQGDSVTLSLPWTFKGSTLPPSSWSSGGFTFDLASWSIASQSKKFLNITGSGMITGHGFDLTAGSWSFTASKTHGVTNSQFSFQTAAAPVPEPSIIAMMVGGCASLIGVQRLFRRRS